MDTGIGYFPTHHAVDPAAMAQLVEERGHTALYFAEHTHIPAARETPWPGGAELPRKYSRMHELFVALTAAAGATRRLRVGSGICLVVQRDPVLTAKTVASVDALSGGRLEFGAGWNREEMANHGTDPRVRMRVMRDRVLAFGDVWFAQHRERPLERIAELRTRAAEAGRDIPVDVIGVPPKAEAIERYEAAGVRRVSFWAPSAGRAVIELALEAFERAVADVHGK